MDAVKVLQRSVDLVDEAVRGADDQVAANAEKRAIIQRHIGIESADGMINLDVVIVAFDAERIAIPGVRIDSTEVHALRFFRLQVDIALGDHRKLARRLLIAAVRRYPVRDAVRTNRSVGLESTA